MVILPLEPAALEELAKTAREAGIKFLTYAIEMENQDGSVGFNSPQGGRILGEAAGNWINETLGGEAKVGILTYTPLEVANQRTDNYEAAILELAPNAQIVGKQDASTVEEGLAVTGTYLQANPDLNVLLGINDDSAVGAYQAFINAGHAPDDPNVFIGGTDGTEDAFRLIKEGGMYRASAALDLRGLAAQSIDAAIAAVEEGKGGTTTIDFTLVTADDPAVLDEFLAPYDA
jgi:ribose transport system substrate-binding protein